MNFNYTENKLTVNEHTIEFHDKIQEVIDFGNCLVVLTDYYRSTTNENVYGVNDKGVKTWQIKRMEKLTHKGKEYDGITEPYSGLTKIDDKRVKLHNWDSTTFEVDPWSGKLLTNPMDSRIGHRPW